MSTRVPFLQLAAVFGCALLLYVLTSAGHLFSPDEEIMFRTCEAIATRGAISIEPVSDGKGGGFASRSGRNGREYAQYGLANSLFAVPLYWAGQVACHFIPSAAAEKALDFQTGFSYVPPGPERGHALLKRFAVSFFGSFVAAATCAAIWLLIFRTFVRNGDSGSARRLAWLVAIAYGAGTMAWPHARTYFSEPLATFFVIVAFAAVSGGIDRWTHVLMAGIAFSLALLTRLDSAVVFPALALYVLMCAVCEQTSQDAMSLNRPADEALRDLPWKKMVLLCVVLCLPVALFGVFQFGLNRYEFGGVLASAYSDQSEGIHFSTPLLAGLYGFLFSVGKSILLFSPALLLAIAGYSAFLKRCPALAASSLAAVLLLLLFHARWQNWPGGWCWGPRHVFMLHAFAVLPIAGLMEQRSRMRNLAYVLVMVPAVCVQLYGCSQNFIDFYLLYYRTPESAPQAFVMYGADDTAPLIVKAQEQTPDGRTRPLSMFRLPAPINDTIYVPQNSQWYKYHEMSQLGYTDNLWLRLLQRARGDEPSIMDAKN